MTGRKERRGKQKNRQPGNGGTGRQVRTGMQERRGKQAVRKKRELADKWGQTCRRGGASRRAGSHTGKEGTGRQVRKCMQEKTADRQETTVVKAGKRCRQERTGK
jgi:hypothetical protein